jgi:hypothetical protein
VSRAHCLDCGDHVVVDPAGRCPEGHHVGVAGARIEGALGSHTPHPDEPEPWVARVELEEDDLPAAAVPAREIRPLSVPGSDLPTDGAVTPPAARADDLLRELHSLGELGDLAAPSGASGARQRPDASTPTTRPPVPTPTGSAPDLGSPPEVWTASAAAPPPASSPAPSGRPAFDELTALEAAVQALTVDRDTAATNGHATNGHASTTGRVDTDDLASSNGHASPDGQASSNGRASSTGRAETSREAAPSATPPSGASGRAIAAQLDELFAEASAAGVPPGEPATTTPTPSDAATGAAPERWSVLADVAELAEHRPAPPVPPAPSGEPRPEAAIPTAPPAEAAPAEPPPPAPAADAGIDLANFTARGKRVGSKGKRRLFGR